MEKAKNIQLKHIGEDYITVSYQTGHYKGSAEITGPAQNIIMALGLALEKRSFKKLEKTIKYN